MRGRKKAYEVKRVRPGTRLRSVWCKESAAIRYLNLVHGSYNFEKVKARVLGNDKDRRQSSEEERKVNALASGADEGRGKLR